tara:strand:+ start:8508 stop:9308 length:801 start_codon:yes stop_codon:yes gene_type:complete
MNTTKILVLISVLFLIFTSCEKVVDLNLDEAPQALVIEAVLFDSIGDNYVIISKSKPFNENIGSFETISGASVVIVDNVGNSYVLNEVADGIYNNLSLKGITGRTYTLSVNVDGKSVTAQSTMQPRVNLDSLSHEKQDNPFSGADEPDSYRIFNHFYDTPNFSNYYRIKAYSRRVQQKGVLVLSDDLIDGDNVVFPNFQIEFEEGDTAIVQLLSIDEENFRYFHALSSSQEGEVPGNPETNLEGENVVGYFGAYAKSQKSIVITPL